MYIKYSRMGTYRIREIKWVWGIKGKNGNKINERGYETKQGVIVCLELKHMISKVWGHASYGQKKKKKLSFKQNFSS